jgi:branched-chain amino acid transport system permease protein
MTWFIQALVDATSIGSIYALTALGIGLIFGIMRLINFAHAEFITIAVYVVMLTIAFGFPVALIAAGLGVLILALLSERLAFRPVRGADPSTLLITSFALSYLLQNTLVLVFGARPSGLNILPELSQPILIGEVRLPTIHLVTIVVTGLLLVATGAFLRKTRMGIEMRAAAADFQMARLLGVRANRVIAAAFGLSGILATAAAILYVAQTGVVEPRLGLHLAVILVLVLRPQGLFRPASARERV